MRILIYMDTAYFAMGCFWHPQVIFDEIEGVVKTVVGYSGGDVPQPTYEMVCGGNTGHYETIEITYDPSIVTYTQLLDAFWQNIDAYDAGGQGPDRGSQYQAALFTTSELQAQAAKDSIAEQDSPESVAVSVQPLKGFYPAEDYHQKYMQKRYRGQL